MEGRAPGRAELTRPPPVYIGNTLVPGTGPTAGSSAKLVRFSSTEQQEEKRSATNVSKIQAILDGLHSSYTTGYPFSNLDPQRLDPVSSGASKSNSIEVIDLCTEYSDQELDGLRTESSYNGIDVEPQAKVKFGQLNGSERTNRGQERQSHHERNSQPRESYGKSSSTIPKPASVKSETTCTEVTAVRGPSENVNVTTSFKLPRHLLDQIEEWYDSDPGKLPPFSTSGKDNVYQTVKGAPMTYWHKAGKPLEVARVDLPKHLYPASLTRNGTWRLLVAKGESVPAFIIRYQGTCKNATFGRAGTQYKAWVGMDIINKDGFELEPSVFKVPVQMKFGDQSAPSSQELSEKIHQNNSRLLRKDMKPPKPNPGEVYWSDMKRGESQIYDLGETVNEREKTLPQLSAMHSENSFSINKPVKTPLRLPEKPSAATSRKRMEHADHSRGTKRRKYADEDFLDATTTASDHERSHLRARTQIASTRVSGPIPDSLELHMRNSTVLLFFPDNNGSNPDSPRPRMLSICDSVGKIFGQALAGSVFAGSNGRGALVLSLRIDNQDQVLPMVEDDEQDFEAFLNALMQAQCWSRDVSGKTTGSCTVEVRAKL
jgi:hypothetical protein